MAKKNKSIYKDLKDKWIRKHAKLQKKLLETHRDVIHSLIPKQQLIGGLMIASVPLISLTPSAVNPPLISAQSETHMTRDELTSRLKALLPKTVNPLTSDQENRISALLSDSYHIKVSPSLEGIRLDRSYGLIGQEQHLARYPGDSVNAQMETQEDYNLYASEGMAPGLGAWGYFASSQQEMSKLDSDREKYYIAVQTFLAPGFSENVGKYVDFFKYRKMLVVNPENGKAIIADIADAGPAQWTGKHLGGSPEVMHHLERVDGAQKGPVLYFFIDDPNDTIPLGPINL